MVTVPEANRLLWEALDALYSDQREALQRTRQALADLAASHPEIARDPMARDALRAATSRQEGLGRYAESQLALAETMRSYWEQRSAVDLDERGPLPLIRRSSGELPATGVGRPEYVPIVAE